MSFERIAIVGMAGRFCGADDLEAFWDNISRGVESTRQYSDEELLAEGVDRSSLTNPQYVKAGGPIADADCFDASFFGYSDREAEMMDPQQRIMLECAWELLEQTGYDPSSYAGLIGVYGGSRMSEYMIFNQSHSNLAVRQTESVITNFQRHIFNDKDFVVTRVSYNLDLRGPSIPVQTACSTSLVAVHLACQGLQSGDCDMALAGGVAVKVPQKAGYAYSEDMIFSPDGHTRPFDAKARGTIFSSGVGLVALKLLDRVIVSV